MTGIPDPAASALDRISAELRTFGASDEDTRRLLAAVEAALKLADEWVPHIPGDPVDLPSLGVALAMQQDCAAKLRAAITAALAGKEAGDGG